MTHVYPPRSSSSLPAAGRHAIADRITMDLHSHAGRVLIGREHRDRPFTALSRPMRDGGMAVVSLAVVADHPATHVEDNRIRPYRDPAPGEHYAYNGEAFTRQIGRATSGEKDGPYVVIPGGD